MKWFKDTKTVWLTITVVALVITLETKVNADFIFGEPTPLPAPINTSYHESGASMSADGLELYYDDRVDIWVATRTTTADDWSTATHKKLGPAVNIQLPEVHPRISADGLELYFSRGWPEDIYRAQRQSLDAPWETAKNLGETINSSDWDTVDCLSVDGLVLYYSQDKTLHMATRATKDSVWVPSENSGVEDNQWGTAIAPSGLHLVLGLPGDMDNMDLWIATRPTLGVDWSAPVNLDAPINSADTDREPWIAYDGSIVFFISDRPGGMGRFDMWQAPILPVVDFNGDAIVDVLDALELLEHWEATDSFLYDIAPSPFGDGVVDARDLRVLADYMVENADDSNSSNGANDISLAKITATASSSNAENTGPEKTIDGSGLNEQGQHSTEATDMWLSGGTTQPEPQWIQYEFGGIYELHEMHVWNSNQMIEPFMGMGAKDVLIETSLDGVEWTTLEGVTQFNQGTGSPDYTANTIVDFGGTPARFVRITITSGYGMWWQWGLSEVRFF